MSTPGCALWRRAFGAWTADAWRCSVSAARFTSGGGGGRPLGGLSAAPDTSASATRSGSTHQPPCPYQVD